MSEIVFTSSPLKYPHGSALRTAFVDPGAGPPAPGEHYFADVVRTSKYSAKGKLLDKPRVVEKIPGAAPGVVSFIDYSAGHEMVFIHYMSTRRDQLRKGLSGKLVDALVAKYGPGVEYNFGSVHHQGAWSLLERLRTRGLTALAARAAGTLRAMRSS